MAHHGLVVDWPVSDGNHLKHNGSMGVSLWREMKRLNDYHSLFSFKWNENSFVIWYSKTI